MLNQSCAVDAVVLRSETGALFRSALMPGWGQFYSDDDAKGLLFFSAGAGTAGSAFGFYIGGSRARAKYEQNKAGTVKQRDVANRHFRTTDYLLMAYGALWALNVLDAYLSGAESTSVRVSPDAGGAVVHF